MFELRYFLAVAKGENIHRASEQLSISPGSLSKAISRLEEELGVKLFTKVGRAIRLTHSGKKLQQRASQIVRMEEACRIEIGGGQSSIHLEISAEEILHYRYSMKIAQVFKHLYPESFVYFQLASEQKVIQQIQDGDAVLGIVTLDPPKGLYRKTLGKVKFRTCVGKSHELAKRTRKPVAIEELLKHEFVVPNFPMLGSVPRHASLDGWRDDKFKRKIVFRAAGLKNLEEIVHSGLAVAYLPDHFVEAIGAKVLNVTGCPYECLQTVRLIARDPKQISWLNRLVHAIKEEARSYASQ